MADPRNASGLSRLRSRLQQAWQEGSPSRIARDVREMALWRLHHWFLDRASGGSEQSQISETTPLEQLTIASDNRSLGVEYTPTPVLISRWLHRFVPGKHADWNFIDIGAGRGRVVAEAARHPYRQVMGVEFAEELAADAKAHLASCDQSEVRAAKVEIAQADATELDMPSGNNVFFLFNPFGKKVLRRFVSRVKENPERKRTLLMYLNPVHDEVLENDKAFTAVKLSGVTGVFLRLLTPFKLKIYELRSWLFYLTAGLVI